MRTLLQDMRYGTRMLTHSPGFTFAAVICLALGIGGTTAIFSIVYAVLMRPLPYAHPDQLVRVYTEFPAFPNGGLRRFWTSPPEFLDLRKYTHSWQWHSRQSASRNYGKASRQESTVYQSSSTDTTAIDKAMSSPRLAKVLFEERDDA